MYNDTIFHRTKAPRNFFPFFCKLHKIALQNGTYCFRSSVNYANLHWRKAPIVSVILEITQLCTAERHLLFPFFCKLHIFALQKGTYCFRYSVNYRTLHWRKHLFNWFPLFCKLHKFELEKGTYCFRCSVSYTALHWRKALIVSVLL